MEQTATLAGVESLTSAASQRASLDCRPFLKWAGGKSKLVPELKARMPKEFGTYFEPFVGGGAFFFALQPKRAVLCDNSPELMNAYRVVQSKVEELILALTQHKHSKQHFYKIRDLDRKADFWIYSDVERASRIIYLNKTCYNGLYRVNARGEFNVPFGDYENPRILDVDNLRLCSMALQHAELFEESFVGIEKRAKRGDFVYFDPPYVPLNATSSFASYGRDGFGMEAQLELRDLCSRLDKQGVHFMLSNSDTPSTRELYQNFRVDSVNAARSINSKSERRGKISELIVTNY